MAHHLILTEQLAEGLNLFGDRWTIAILREAFYGATGFDEFRKGTGISRATLTRRLVALREIGIFDHIQSDTGRRKQYRLSKLGLSLMDASLLALTWESRWRKNRSLPKRVAASLKHESCGTHLVPQTICRHCRADIHYSDLEWLDKESKLDQQAEAIQASYNKYRRSYHSEYPELTDVGLPELIGDRWTMLILLACFFDTKNFDRFIERINIPSSILAKRLRYLVEVDILERKTQNNDHRRHEYQLSDKGKSLFPFVMLLRQWVNQKLLAQRPNPRLVHASCGKPLVLEVICQNCRSHLTARAVTFERRA